MECIKTLPKIKDFSEDPINTLVSELPSNETDKTIKGHINQIFNYIISNFRHVTLGQTKNVAETIMRIYKLVGKKADKCLNYCHFVFENISL